MTSLATIQDVEDRLGRSLTGSESIKVEALLTDASALVVGYTGQQFLTGTSTSLLQVKLGKIRMPQRPVTAVDSVETLSGEPVSFDWDNYQNLYVDTANYSQVVVTYEHGEDSAPADVIAVVAGLALRTFQVSPEAAMGVTQQATGPFSVTYAAWAVGGQVVLSPTDRAILDRYRIRAAGAIDTLG
jgi:hypothetical protein